MDLGYISRIRWFMLAFGVAALMLTVMSAPASASAPDKKIETFMEVMSDSGHAFDTAVEAQDALTKSGIPVDVAIELLEMKGLAAADYFLPLVMRVVESTERPIVVPPIEPLAGDELWRTAASTRCRNHVTTVEWAGGASGITVLWHRLSASHCFNGSRIVGTPTSIVSSGTTAWGLALGYKWTTRPSVTDAYWVTFQRQYRIVAAGWYKVCPKQNPWWCFGGSRVWIQQDKFASGGSEERAGRG